MDKYQLSPGASEEFDSGLQTTAIDRSLHTSSDIDVVKQSTAAPTSHLNPKTIFGHPIEIFTLQSVKKILSLFKKQGSIRKTSTLETLLPKILDLECKVTFEEHITVAQLLANNRPLTRSSLRRGFRDCDDDGEEVFTGENRTCQICLESLPAAMFRKGLCGYEKGELTANCRNHGHHSLCTDCAKAYMMATCESRHWHDIRCPLCPEKIEASTVAKYLSGDMLLNYNEYMRTSKMRHLPGFSWCLSPSCSSGQVHTPGDASPNMICQKCGFATCYSHQLPWHHGKTCEQAGGLKSKEDRDSEAWIRSQTKNCPHCSVATMKSGGCDGIFCKCGKSWNWKSNI